VNGENRGKKGGGHKGKRNLKKQSNNAVWEGGVGETRLDIAKTAGGYDCHPFISLRAVTGHQSRKNKKERACTHRRLETRARRESRKGYSKVTNDESKETRKPENRRESGKIRSHKI